MCICLYMYVHIYMCIYIYIHVSWYIICMVIHLHTSSKYLINISIPANNPWSQLSLNLMNPKLLYKHIYTCAYVCMHIAIYVHMCIYIYICIYVYMYIYIYIYVYIYIYIYIYMYIYIYVYIYTYNNVSSVGPPQDCPQDTVILGH